MDAEFLATNYIGDEEQPKPIYIKKSKYIGPVATIFSIFIVLIPLTIVTLVLLKDSIRIQKDSLDGEKKDVLRAIEHLKINSLNDYKYVCKHIDSVILGKCLSASKSNNNVLNINTRACYLKGTKSVYINTKISNTDFSPKSISSLILKYAKESAVFWREQGN